MESNQQTLESVERYYGKVLSSKDDLQSNACCTSEQLPLYVRDIIASLHDEVVERFYGCGSPIPPALEGCTVLDLGCGSGRDCYVLSKLVGPQGRVIGVDMTDEQLEVARRHIDYHRQAFGYQDANVEFLKGYIEDLRSADIADNSIDVVVSNCVINLSPNKEQVFSEIFRVLKPGGELYFSDVFALRRVPSHLRQDPVLLGECLSGALYVEDFRRVLAMLGCPDYRVTASRPVTVSNPELEARIGMVPFRSCTVRAFKLDELEDRCEDYGQIATYRGSVAECPHHFELDDHHLFEAGKPFAVCGNTAAMLSQTRYGEHFQVSGNRDTHFGLFDCSSGEASAASADPAACC